MPLGRVGRAQLLAWGPNGEANVWLTAMIEKQQSLAIFLLSLAGRRGGLLSKLPIS